MVKVVASNDDYQSDVDAMMKEISLEFDESIFSNSKKDLSVPLDRFWVALKDTNVVGTVGILVIEKQFGILKNMMVKKAFRGGNIGVSNLLLRTAIEWCVKNNIQTVYLGTMTQFKAAQSFYLKNGFKQISETELPKSFINNPLDKVFFKLDL